MNEKKLDSPSHWYWQTDYFVFIGGIQFRWSGYVGSSSFDNDKTCILLQGGNTLIADIKFSKFIEYINKNILQGV